MVLKVLISGIPAHHFLSPHFHVSQLFCTISNTDGTYQISLLDVIYRTL